MQDDRVIVPEISKGRCLQQNLRLHTILGGCGADTGSSEGTFKQTSAETLVPFESVLNNDIAALPRFIGTLAETIVGQMKQNIYATVSTAADQAGNTVSVKAAGSLAQAFLQMLNTIEFGVNSNGKD